MIVELICGLAVFGAGTAVGRTLERLDLAARNRVDADKPIESGVAITTDRIGHVTFKGTITASDFLDAMNRLRGPDRKLVLSRHGAPAHTLHALFLLFSHLPQKEKA